MEDRDARAPGCSRGLHGAHKTGHWRKLRAQNGSGDEAPRALDLSRVPAAQGPRASPLSSYGVQRGLGQKKMLCMPLALLGVLGSPYLHQEQWCPGAAPPGFPLGCGTSGQPSHWVIKPSRGLSQNVPFPATFHSPPHCSHFPTAAAWDHFPKYNLHSNFSLRIFTVSCLISQF